MDRKSCLGFVSYVAYHVFFKGSLRAHSTQSLQCSQTSYTYRISNIMVFWHCCLQWRSRFYTDKCSFSRHSIYRSNFQRKKFSLPKVKNVWISKFFSIEKIPVYIFSLILFAYAEEWLWDNLVWHERPELFGDIFNSIQFKNGILICLVPLLALPQATHYVLDAFIWRIHSAQKDMQPILDSDGMTS